MRLIWINKHIIYIRGFRWGFGRGFGRGLRGGWVQNLFAQFFCNVYVCGRKVPNIIPYSSLI